MSRWHTFDELKALARRHPNTADLCARLYPPCVWVESEKVHGRLVGVTTTGDAIVAVAGRDKLLLIGFDQVRAATQW